MRTGKPTTRTDLRVLAAALVAAVTLSLAGCANTFGTRNGGAYGSQPPPRNAQRNCTDCGTVRRVRQTYVEKNSSTLGTVIGAVVGGAVGNQVGGGSGRTLATVAGAVAGGAAGHAIGKNHKNEVEAWQIVVREDNGRAVTVTQKENPHVQRGDRVQVRNGHVYLL